MKMKLSTLATGFGMALAFVLLPASHASEASPEQAALPAQALTPEILYTVLLGEIAGARGEIGIAVEAYLQMARRTRDPRIARRATEIALFARHGEAATEAARIWVEADPASEDARRVLASVLASSGDRLNEIQIHLARILATNPDQLEQNLLGLHRALARVPDRATVRSIVERLTEPYLEEPAAHFARAQAAIATEDSLAALAAIDSGLALRPGWEPAVLFKSQILVQMGAVLDALAVLRGQLADHPDSRNTRLTYARTLVSAQDFPAARVEFQKLLDATPDDRDLIYAVALVSAQVGDLDAAVPLFKRALAAGHPEADGIRLNLGNIAERRAQPDEARRWYGEIESGQHYFEAQVRIATLIARTGDVDRAREHLHSIEVDEQHYRQILLAETMLLRNAKRYAEALGLIDSALRENPGDPELLYESAMLAERLDRIDIMEARLRDLIARAPEHAHAYNALGYTLADRGLRIDEAEALIARALELAPDDPFILDSMGWVRFRRNDAEGALEHLERAYTLRKDPEIAAHLGEVLWSLDRRDEARSIWDEALQMFPDNEPLNETMGRFLDR